MTLHLRFDFVLKFILNFKKATLIYSDFKRADTFANIEQSKSG